MLIFQLDLLLSPGHQEGGVEEQDGGEQGRAAGSHFERGILYFPSTSLFAIAFVNQGK